MNTTTKITKANRYEDIITILEGVAEVDGLSSTPEELIAFCEHELELLAKKSAKAKETAATKKMEKDALTEAVEAVLTDEFMTRQEITDRVDFADATVSKVGYRLTKLVEIGVAEKSEVSVGGENGGKARKVVAYRLLGDTSVED